MKRNKIILLGLMILIAFILLIPSILYLVNNKTVDGFDSYYTYTLVKSNNETARLISGISVIGLIIIFSVCYLLVIKQQKEIFKNTKQIILFITLISIMFMMILPYLSSDIYYYIGDSWLASKYGENPYYTTVEDLQNNGINDEILNNTGYWKNTTSVYGPLWNSLAKLFVTFSFGSVTIALFIFKIASLLIHVLNCYLINKITKSNKYMLLYGLNPLVLIEFLNNVHNDIYLVLFMLLALYFLIRKKNVIFTIIFLALSISIKYSTVLLVPFILIYCFRKKSIPQRILFCTISGLSIILLVVLFYLPYYQDVTIFINMLVQGKRYSQSINTFLLTRYNWILQLIKPFQMPMYVIMYIRIISILLCREKINIKEIMKQYNYILIAFIFVILTNFQKWYILWILPTIIWQSKNMRNFILYLTITAIIPSIDYFIVHGDPYILGIGYSIKILIMSGVLVVLNILINCVLRKIKLFEIKNKKDLI